MNTQTIPSPSIQQAQLLDSMNRGFLIPSSTEKTTERSSCIAVGQVLTIGRDLSCELSLPDPFVSARHARIERQDNKFIVRDLHSRNGTFLNGSRIKEAELCINDQIRFGETVYFFSEAASKPNSMNSKNTEWSKQLERLPVFAATDFPILITGPSGSGKDILARQIHELSKRERAPFISINCSALSESLIESELFGHIKGSFTGATHDRKGAFEAARGGTLFLDEVGDLPLNLQPKLLRALENSEIRPVGSDRSIEIDVRIIAATHKNLSFQIKHGNFREDLFYRLNVCHLRPPSLAQRMEDFDQLFYLFAKQYRVRFSFNAIARLKEHPWPGNIRELKNLVARASAYFPGKHIQPEDLAAILDTAPSEPPAQKMQNISTTPHDGVGQNLVKSVEREMIIRSLIQHRGNQRRAAAELGIPKSTLHDRIKTYQIDLLKLIREEGLY
jgi:DNA-binding NtrC family response regulator